MQLEYKGLYAYICDFVDLSVYDDGFVERILYQVCTSNNYTSYNEMLQYIQSNLCLINEINSKLSISYSRFYRNRFTYEVLKLILMNNSKDSLNMDSEIRIWSAGCAKGEEPYSIAILMNEINRYKGDKLKFRIFATDKNSEILLNAKSDNYTYTKNEVSNLTISELERYLIKDGEGYKIQEALKTNITFEQHDLLDKDAKCPSESIFGGFNIIFCSNVLIYYNAHIQDKIINKFENCLVNNGFLVCDDSEREIFMKYGLKEVFPNSCVFKINSKK